MREKKRKRGIERERERERGGERERERERARERKRERQEKSVIILCVVSAMHSRT